VVLRTLTLLLAGELGAMAAAQEPVVPRPQPDQSLEWAVALGDRFRHLHDPVVATYALGRLAETVCSKDPVAGTALFRDSLERLRVLTPKAFSSARRRLPLPTFTALWKSLTPAAEKCAPELADLADTERAEAKMSEERQQAPENLKRAFSSVGSDPDRAAQLAEAAISASEPALLDIPTLTLFLSSLRERAGDLADEFFPDALDFIASDPQPSPGLLLELGKYLFTAPRYRDLPDEQQAGETYRVGGTTIANFAANRQSANSDDMRLYIDAVVKVLSASNDSYYDPVAAYAIGFQMLPKAEDIAPEIAGDLRKAVAQVAQLAGSGVAQVQAALGGLGAGDPQGGEGPRKRYRLVGRALSAAAGGRFPEARDLVKGVDDVPVQSQARSLIDFAESAGAIGERDLQWSFTLANTLKGGVKRALLYAGLAAAAPNRDDAFGFFSLGLRDAELLPAEQRMLTRAALAGAVFRIDPESGLTAFKLLTEAANDAYTSPRQGRFDPQVIRKVKISRATTFTDSSLILANSRGLREVVDTGRGWHSFALKIPGVHTLDLPAAVRSASGEDTGRIEALLLGIRDENLMAAGLNALAALRLAR
jgi:hypothetical protein